jgi:peroxiredoxin
MFSYTISIDITKTQGAVILIDGTTREPVNIFYPKSPEFKIEGELPIEKMHDRFVLHFPSKYYDPNMFPVNKVGSVYIDMDRETKIVGHFDTLMLVKVENEYTNKLKQFKEQNFPTIIELKNFIMDGVYGKSGGKRTAAEQKAYAEKGNALNLQVTNDLITKAGQFPKSEEMVIILAINGGGLGFAKLDSLTQLLDESVHQTKGYKKLLGLLDYMKSFSKPKSLEAGQVAPSFSLNDAEGNVHSLSDFKGKYVVLDFWASWCGPCKKEMPFMKKLYKKYHAKGLEMIAISTDKDRDAWLKAKNKLNMPYLQLHDKNGVAANSYFVRGIPYVLLIDPKGNILAIERGEALESLIKQKLNS